jgi:hypothetical protein
MKFYFLKNIFNSDDRYLIDFAVRGMAVANSTEVHAGQNDGCFGSFSEALQRIFDRVYGEKAAEAFYGRYNFDNSSGEEFFEWFDAIVKQDQSEVGDILSNATVQLETS